MRKGLPDVLQCDEKFEFAEKIDRACRAALKSRNFAAIAQFRGTCVDVRCVSAFRHIRTSHSGSKNKIAGREPGDDRC
jgi:hypothetical protein